MPGLETSLYSVLLLNDDETPMEFVVHVLEAFFDMDRDTAKQTMFLAHHQGIVACGYYPYEPAKKKAADVVVFARQHNYPLRCTFEKALRVPSSLSEFMSALGQERTCALQEAISALPGG